MKRYILFIMYHYYPSGGLHDIEESYDSLEEAQDFISGDKTVCPVSGRQYEVVDRDTWEVIYRDRV